MTTNTTTIGPMVIDIFTRKIEEPECKHDASMLYLPRCGAYSADPHVRAVCQTRGMWRTFDDAKQDCDSAGSAFANRFSARIRLANATRALQLFRELDAYPSTGRQRQKYVRKARDVARSWFSAILDWQQSTRAAGVAVRAFDCAHPGYLLQHWNIYQKYLRLMTLRQNESDHGVTA